jgi:TonB-dependent receptor
MGEKGRKPSCGLLGASLLALGAVLSMSGAASAQEAAPGATESTEDEIVVTGYRASLRSALELKRNSGVMIDAINAEDIADFPDANLAESLQRIPGISIDRDNGEGRLISVRGLGPDFSRVRINGLEALATAGVNDAGTNPNRSRSFDFNVFASELFNSLRVQKTSSAETDEGSLGATVDLITARPFDYEDTTFAFSAQDAYYENGEFHNPRFAGLLSNRWFGGKLGALASVAYSSRDTEIDQYRRQPGQADYLYRNSNWLGNENPQRAGFSAPVGTTFGSVITNPAAIAAQTGSDPDAYAALFPGEPFNTPGRFDDSIVRIPALASIEQQDLHQERLGITNSYQWEISDRTQVNVDLLYSRFRNESTINQVSSVGLNRNNTNTTYNTASASSSVSTRRGLYPGRCTPRAGTDIIDAFDCGEALYGTTPVPGFQFSVNPFNLDPYEYYNNPNSVGFTPDPTGLGLGFRNQLIGRPGVDVLAAHVSEGGVADYLELRNVDFRSAADASFYTTTFQQGSINIEHAFTNSFRFDFIYGQSRSYNKSQGLLVEFNHMDDPGTFVYDEREGGDMPVVDFGFNAADPANWGIVKGFSAIRHFQRFVDNRYEGGRLDFTWDISDSFSLLFGTSARRFAFKTEMFERGNDVETIIPTELEAGVTSAQLGRVIQFGQGLELPGGTMTSFYAPSLDAFNDVFGFKCNCINQYSDWRLTNKRNGGRENFRVTEDDTGYYAQLNWNLDLFGRELFGNAGVRHAITELMSRGTTSTGRPITGTNDYSDTLPALNVAYEVAPDLLVRFGAAKVMARPLLGNLAPTITAITVPMDPAGTGSMTIGNPKLNPFRATNYDASVEWYFAEGGLFSVAYFWKDIESFPQTVFFSGPLSTFLDPEAVAALRLQFTNQDQLDFIDADGTFRARQFRDAPGGWLGGWEFSYQQDFTFLPGWLSNFGAQLNFTHIESKLNYILDPGNGTSIGPTTAPGPWLNASPNALNATVYYETDNFSARVSVAQRDSYYTTYPIAGGTCSPGLVTPLPDDWTPDRTAGNNQPGGPCQGPLINDFVGSEETLNVDAALRWNYNERLSFTLEGLNLTNQTTNRFAYVDSPVVTQYGSTGRQITMGLRYRY